MLNKGQNSDKACFTQSVASATDSRGLKGKDGGGDPAGNGQPLVGVYLDQFRTERGTPRNLSRGNVRTRSEAFGRWGKGDRGQTPQTIVPEVSRPLSTPPSASTAIEEPVRLPHASPATSATQDETDLTCVSIMDTVRGRSVLLTFKPCHESQVASELKEAATCMEELKIVAESLPDLSLDMIAAEMERLGCAVTLGSALENSVSSNSATA